MGIIWDLFGVRIILTSILLILFIAWPRKHKIIRKRLIQSTGLILLISILTVVYAYWPKSYDKKYLKESHSFYSKDISLRELADSADFRIGIAVSNDSLSHYYVP
jgi:hypothetical protein